MAQWKDVTSYSREQRGMIAPRAWELLHWTCRLSIHRIHGLGDTSWFMSCNALDVDKVEILDYSDKAIENVEEAQRMAIVRIEHRIETMLRSLIAANLKGT